MAKLIDPAMNFYNRHARDAVDDAFSTLAVGKSSPMAEIVSQLNDELLRRTERIKRLEIRLAAQTEHIRVLREALDKIASWDEGPVVTGTFDEPHAAMVARAALEKTK